MDLRIGQRVVKPGSDTTLLALKHTQQLQHQLFLASLHQQQVEQLAHQHVRVRAAWGAQGGTPAPAFGSGRVGIGHLKELILPSKHVARGAVSVCQRCPASGLTLPELPALAGVKKKRLEILMPK